MEETLRGVKRELVCVSMMCVSYLTLQPNNHLYWSYKLIGDYLFIYLQKWSRNQQETNSKISDSLIVFFIIIIFVRTHAEEALQLSNGLVYE